MAQPPSISNEQIIAVLMEEYRAMYALAQFRLTALDRRMPITGGALAAFLGAVTVLPTSAQLVALIAVPLALVWVLRTTITHARSFEDALRRIEMIELTVNRLIGDDVMVFQSRHPSRGLAGGGRTGIETVVAVLIGCLGVLLACAWLSSFLLAAPWSAAAPYLAYLGLIALLFGWESLRYRRYRYALSSGTGASTHN